MVSDPPKKNPPGSPQDNHLPLLLSQRSVIIRIRKLSPRTILRLINRLPVLLRRFGRKLSQTPTIRQKKNYSPSLITFCSALFLISATSYILFAKIFKLPSTRTIERSLQRTRADVGEMQRNLSCLPDLIRQYLKREDLKENQSKLWSYLLMLFFRKKS